MKPEGRAMGFTSRFLTLVLLTVGVVLAGCVPLPPGRGDSIGTLRVSGANVWLNNSAGRDGATVRIGSSIATGPGSSALVEFRDGGILQLDENTDPIFDWLEQTKCILIRIFKGQAYLSKGHACVEGPNLALVLDSKANIRIRPEANQVVLTLLQGSANLSDPAPKRLLPGQQLTLSGKRIASLKNLSSADLSAVVAWRDRYRFRQLTTTGSAPETPWLVPLPPHREPSEPAPSPTPPKTDPPPKTGTSSPAAVDKPFLVPKDKLLKPTGPVIK